MELNYAVNSIYEDKFLLVKGRILAVKITVYQLVSVFT